MEPKTLGALAAVLAVSAGLAYQHFVAGRPETVRAPDPVEVAAPAASLPGVARSVGSSMRPTAAPAPHSVLASGAAAQVPGGAAVVVDVSGKVRRPGVYRLPAGSRVADALREAGGAKGGVDTDGLNRARVLTDGEQVVVGGPPPPQGAGAWAGSGTGAGTGVGGNLAAGPLSLNSATVEQLDTLPGVGPVLAQHIVEYRVQHGGFRAVEELREVNGIGDRRFSDLQNLVRP